MVKQLKARYFRFMDTEQWDEWALVFSRDARLVVPEGDADHARGIWAMFDYVKFPTASDGTRFGLQGYGHYTEESVRDDGAWRIASLHLSRLRIDPLSAPTSG